MAELFHARRQLRDRPEFKNMPQPLACKEDTSVAEAVRLMCDRRFGCIVITDDEQHVLGILTERDIMTRVVNAHRDAEKTRVDEVMTPSPNVIHETDTVVDCLRMMSNKRFRRLPMVDEHDQLKRVFTQGDFVSYTWPDLLHDLMEGTKASVTRNYPLWMFVGGVGVYAVMMSLVLLVLLL